jgi:hypothetical protein
MMDCAHEMMVEQMIHGWKKKGSVFISTESGGTII